MLRVRANARSAKVKLIVRDTKSDAVTAANAAQELLDLGAHVLLGPPTDDGLIPMAELAKPRGVAVLSVGSTQPAFPVAAPDNGYLVPYGDNASAAAAAEVAYERGYRKALLKMQLAAKFGIPILTLINTPGAYPGVGAEERGQAFIIAKNLMEMARLAVPVICVVVGEGGSGGALGIGVGNRVLMLEHGYYSVISPEGCAAILWGDAAKAAAAAEIMKMTAPDLLRLGVIDAVVPEPPGGAHRDWEATAAALRGVLLEQLDQLAGRSPEALVAERHDKYRRLWAFEEEAAAVR